MNARVLAGVMFFAVTVGCDGAPAVVMIPVTDHLTHRVVANLETRVYRPSGLGPFPVMILSHGSSAGNPKRSVTWAKEGPYFAKKGYIVLAPMRRGRGRSTGESAESEQKNCNLSSWLPGLSSAMQDIDASIEFARTLPEAKAEQIVLFGVSRGGFLSVAYAAEGAYRTDVRQVINVVGGWVAQAEDQCPTDFNAVSFSRFGALTRTPMLWLYGAGDQFYGDSAVRTYSDLFKKAGGQAVFHLIEGIPENGHSVLEYPAKWMPYVDSFLTRPPTDIRASDRKSRAGQQPR